MGLITTLEARAEFTKQVVAIYKERPMVMSFLRSFFQETTSNSKNISIEVQRGTEKVAVDVRRGTRGNRNTFSLSTEKVFTPPYYREYFDATELDFYDRLFTEDGTVDNVTFKSWMEAVIEKLGILQDKIERAYEIQCSQVFETGIVQLQSGTNIDFKRKSDSLVDAGAASYWATGTADPIGDLEAGCTFIRNKGKAQGAIYNVIMGASAFRDFKNNAKVKEEADIRRFSLVDIHAPQRNAAGGTLKGQVSAGAYELFIWCYTEVFDGAGGTNINYVNDKKIIIIPEKTNFKLSFAAVPQLLGIEPVVGAGIKTERGAFLIGEHLDQTTSSHNMDIKSAGVAVPVAIDTIYTQKVVTG